MGAALLALMLPDTGLAQTERPDDDAPADYTLSTAQDIFLPYIFHTERSEQTQMSLCPHTSDRSYSLIPVDGPPTDHPDTEHGDLNLSLRGYSETRAALTIVDINGPADGDALQLPGIFMDQRTPEFLSTHRVYTWDWSCGDHGCRGNELTKSRVSLLGMAVGQDEPVSIPSRGPEIYGGGFTALVLYAAPDRITLGYTRHDTVAAGYAVHIERICVDPSLLSLYRQADLAGRAQLPALRNGEILGSSSSEIRVAVRDRGTFMDPRSRKDWWKGR